MQKNRPTLKKNRDSSKKDSSNDTKKFRVETKRPLRSRKSTAERLRHSDKTNISIEQMNAPARLNKVIAESGLCSRRKADELITSGVVKVNGKVASELGTKVERSDFITVNGDPIPETRSAIYVLLNKPKDVITTTDDERDRKTVVDLVKVNERVFPVGRLDRNTTGIILLTNDGELAHRLSHPSYQIERIYNVLLDKNLMENHAKQIAKGVELEDGKTGECSIFIHPGQATKVTVTLFEGKNREVRRIFEHFGYEVKQLDRKAFAGLEYKGVGRGDFRFLSRVELLNLKRVVKLI